MDTKVSTLKTNLKLLIRLSRNDLKSKYAGSFFGIVWSFVSPLVTIGVFYFVFQVGFKNPPVEDIEFVLWISPAYLAWTYFLEMILNSSGCLFEYSYLVKKIKFDTKLIPLVKVLSSTYIHFFFIVFIFIMFLVYGYVPKLMWFQVFYYNFCLFVFAIGLSLICSAVTVFFKDFSQIVNVVLQIGFWATPIFWSSSSISPAIIGILKLNPIYYIIQGYRDSFISGVGFWHHLNLTIYFWIFTLVILILGVLIFKKLRQHFADIL